jgi:hypothetical protein
MGDIRYGGDDGGNDRASLSHRSHPTPKAHRSAMGFRVMTLACGRGARDASRRVTPGTRRRRGPASLRTETRPRPCQGHTPIIDTRHDGEHLLRSRNATFAPRHATHTHASLRSVSGAAAHTRNASGAQSPSLTVAFGTRSRDRSGRPWPRHAESRSARGGPGCRYSVSPPALRNLSVRPETRD